jgi:hypothetical protein
MIKIAIKNGRRAIEIDPNCQFDQIANKLTLGMARANHIKKDVLASAPAWLLHLPGTLRKIKNRESGIFNLDEKLSKKFAIP